MRSITRMDKIAKTIYKSMWLVLGSQESRDSTHAAIMPIWAATGFEPSTVRLITGATELLS